MAQKLVQTQTEKQQQTLLPLQLALVKLLELPLADLEERVQNEMLENAALEESDGAEEAENAIAETDDNADLSGEETATDVELADYLSSDDVPAYLQARAEAADTRYESTQAGSTSFYESLQQQIGEHNLSEQERTLMDYLIGSLDGDGFLRKDLYTLADELAVYHNVETSAEELERLLAILQTFEPRGIGARDLQECLRLQLNDPDNRSPWRKRALEVVERCFKDFVGKRWDNIMTRLKMEPEEFEHVIHELTHLNPVPGRALNESEADNAPTVVPDFFVSVGEDGTVFVSLNNGDVPELRVSRAFRDTITEYAAAADHLNREQRETYHYARQKVEAAQTFISLLMRRQETLLKVMQTIVELQRPFFDDDDEQLLRPMVLKDIATRIGMNVSTVSRVTGSKYVQTAFGVYPLKFFFSSQFTSEGGEDLSTRRVKAALREAIDAEDKQSPLADEALTALLKEKGLPVARRTVTKYRVQMGIPVARFRKEYSPDSDK